MKKYTLSVEEALEEMKKDKSVMFNSAGWLNLIGDRVYFGCPGEYPCCHYDMNIYEFLADFKEDKFCVKE